ncbi:MAG: segregation/condensation protein A [Gammaproteobacteria bacterium]|nr:segregation/condensation protein A [Gammaproteobacteria bacterium]
MKTYEVKTPVFEGPLDLLLQLITRRQVEITAVSLVDLVDEYLKTLQTLGQLDMDVTSEFVLIASTLIQLKARRLLPTDDGVELDEELELMEERDRLLSRLLACVTFRDVAAVIAYRLEEAGRYVARSGGMDFSPLQKPPETVLTINAEGLAALAERLLEATEIGPDLDHFDLDLPSVGEAMADLRSRVVAAAEADFSDLVAHAERTVEVVAYFLALLELARWGVVEASQAGWLSEIHVKATETKSTEEVVSEWE